MTAKKNKKSPQKRWNPDSARNMHRLPGTGQFDPDYNDNQNKFPPIEREEGVGCDFGIKNDDPEFVAAFHKGLEELKEATKSL